jgi:serine/threonine protein phosphatase PrpC
MALNLCCSVIPGIDPREEVNKECQDGMFHIFADNQLLFGLFDGHGKEGLKIVEFSSRSLKAYFLAHLQEFKIDAEAAIVQALHNCDEQVKRQIECSVSGT